MGEMPSDVHETEYACDIVNTWQKVRAVGAPFHGSW